MTTDIYTYMTWKYKLPKSEQENFLYNYLKNQMKI